MEVQTILSDTLVIARRVLYHLEEQAAGYTSLTIPVHLKIELEDQRIQVADIENRLETFTASKRTKIFISYTNADLRWLERIKVHLTLLEQENLIETWDNTKINPGTIRQEEIKKALKLAKIAVPIISADFLASDRNELAPILKAYKEEGLIILPLIASPCSYGRSDLNQFQPFNEITHPLVALKRSDREFLFTSFAEHIFGLVTVKPNI